MKTYLSLVALAVFTATCRTNQFNADTQRKAATQCPPGQIEQNGQCVNPPNGPIEPTTPTNPGGNPYTPTNPANPVPPVTNTPPTPTTCTAALIKMITFGQKCPANYAAFGMDDAVSDSPIG